MIVKAGKAGVTSQAMGGEQQVLPWTGELPLSRKENMLWIFAKTRYRSWVAYSRPASHLWVALRVISLEGNPSSQPWGLFHGWVHRNGNTTFGEAVLRKNPRSKVLSIYKQRSLLCSNFHLTFYLNWSVMSFQQWNWGWESFPLRNGLGSQESSNGPCYSGFLPPKPENRKPHQQET